MPDARAAVQHRNYLTGVGARPHQRGIAAAAERQCQRIKKNGLAGARLARECREPTIQRQVELVDQDDVANRKRAEHP